MGRPKLVGKDNEAQFSDPYNLRLNYGEQLCPENKYWRNVPRFLVPEKDHTLFDEDKLKLGISSPGEKEFFGTLEEDDEFEISLNQF